MEVIETKIGSEYTIIQTKLRRPTIKILGLDKNYESEGFTTHTKSNLNEY